MCTIGSYTFLYKSLFANFFKDFPFKKSCVHANCWKIKTGMLAKRRAKGASREDLQTFDGECAENRVNILKIFKLEIILIRQSHELKLWNYQINGTAKLMELSTQI